MLNLKTRIIALQKEGKALFYNSTGSKIAYQLGVKHISSAEFLGYADSLPNKDIRVKKAFILVDFEKNEIIEILKGSRLTPKKLESY